MRGAEYKNTRFYQNFYKTAPPPYFTIEYETYDIRAGKSRHAHDKYISREGIMTTLLINTRVKQGHIAPEIQGQFSEHLGRGIYEGIFVREDSGIPNVRGMRTDVVDALKEIHVPLLRWPGGCFADEYHWMDGIGPRENRKKMINTNWGGVTEDNSFGTHEFFDLCEQLGCKTYVNGNLGSGTVQEMHDWVEYITFDGVSPMADLRRRNGREKPWKLDWFAVGNESWGCGGNMRPSYYGDLYRQYQSFLRQYNPDSPFKKLAVGASVDDAEWTRAVLATCFDHAQRQFHGFMDGLSLHYYTIIGDDWTVKGGALNFDEAMWYKTMQSTLHMEDLLRMHGAIMDQYDPEKKIAMCVDEWGAWYDVEPGTNPGFLYQQNTMRDALIAGINLNIFNKHCDRVGMACIAQTINVLQSMLLTEGGQCVKTPTYWVFDLYKDHQDAELLDSCLSDVPRLSIDTAALSGKIDDGTGAAARSSVEDGFLKAERFTLPAVQESVSEKNGVITITLTNLDLENACPLDIVFSGSASLSDRTVTGEIVHGTMTAHNTFEEPDCVTKQAFQDIQKTDSGLSLRIPACSVLKITVQ